MDQLAGRFVTAFERLQKRDPELAVAFLALGEAILRWVKKNQNN